MVRKELSETEIAESIPDLWQPLTQEQREFLAQNFTIQKYKKNETIYCEGETPMHLMCLLSGKVKIYKEGVGGRSQIIRVLKTKEYFAYRAFFAEGNFVTAASAFEPCTICLIPMPAIMKLIKDNSEYGGIYRNGKPFQYQRAFQEEVQAAQTGGGTASGSCV